MTDHLPAWDIEPGWQVWQSDHDRWITVEVVVQTRRADGSRWVSWFIAEDEGAIDAIDGEQKFTVRWESSESS